MLADAVVDIALAEIVGGDVLGLAGLVLFEPVRSAEPPMVSGTAPLITSSAISDDLRVATFACRRRASSCSRRSRHRSSAARHRVAALELAALGSVGTGRTDFPGGAGLHARCAGGTPGVDDIGGNLEDGESQPKNFRAPAISSAPSGEPCALLVPALVRAPKPMVVLQAIIVGLSEWRAASIA